MDSELLLKFIGYSQTTFRHCRARFYTFFLDNLCQHSCIPRFRTFLTSWIHNILTRDFPQRFHSQHILRIWYIFLFRVSDRSWLPEFITSWHVTSLRDSTTAHITDMMYFSFHVSYRSWTHNTLTRDVLHRFHYSTYYEYDILFIPRFTSFLTSWIHNILTRDFLHRFHSSIYYECTVRQMILETRNDFWLRHHKLSPE